MTAELRSISRSVVGRRSTVAVALRAATAIPAIGLMALTVLGLGSWVKVYAVHHCGWPAMSGCDDPVMIWWLVPAGFGAVATIAVLAQLAWVRTRSHRAVAWVMTLWLVAFPYLVLGTGPRQFKLSDLILLGTYAGLGIGLSRQALVAWSPDNRRKIDKVALSATAAYAALLVILPFHLAALSPDDRTPPKRPIMFTTDQQ